MTEAMELKLVEILTRGMEVAEKTGEFVVEQSPDLVQQLLAWHFTFSLIAFVIVGVLYPTFWGYLAIKVWKVPPDGRSLFRQNSDLAIGYFAGLSTSFLLLVAILDCNDVNLFDWLKITVAPKIYLLEYVAGLVK